MEQAKLTLNLIHYVEKGTSKSIIINLNAVAKFRQGDEVTPLLKISYPNNPDYFIDVPYLWGDFLKNFYTPPKG